MMQESKMMIILVICSLILPWSEGTGTQPSSGLAHAWVRNDIRLWPLGRIDYVMEERYEDIWRNNIRNAMETLTNITDGDECLEFRELENVPLSPPYIQFIHSECKSNIGMVMDNATKVYLGPLCYSDDLILHELLHSLGAVHEHNREDRDIFVKINYTNIKDEYLDQYEIKESLSRTFQTVFDYNSIMLYPKNVHAKDERFPTMEPRLMLNEGFLEKVNKELSPADIVELSRAYGCDVDNSTMAKYENYLNKVLVSVLNAFSSCVDENTNPDESCKDYQRVSQFMLQESENTSSVLMYAIHNNHYQQVLDKLTLRREMKNSYDRTKTSLSRMSEKLDMMQRLFNKTWFGDSGVRRFQGKGYQVIAYRKPWCHSRYSGGLRASINSQEELDFIVDLLGDRAALLGGRVEIAPGQPLSYEGFYWLDGSPTNFILSNAVDKVFHYYGDTAWLKSGILQIGGPYPDSIVCKYP